MLEHLHLARRLAFVCGLSTAVIAAHVAAYAATASVAGSANTGINANSSVAVPAPMPGAVPNRTIATPPNTTNATPPNTMNGVPPNTINGLPTNPNIDTNTNTNDNTNANSNPNANTNTNLNTNNGMAQTPPNGTNTVRPQNATAAEWNAEDQYWRNNFSNRPYAHDNVNYTMYRPAFQFGVNTFSQFGGRPFNDINQDQLRASWQQANPSSNLTWDQAGLAIRDSYDRLYQQRANGVPATTNSQ